MKIGELGISPLKLSAVEAHLVNPGAGAAAFDFSPCTATVLLRRLVLSLLLLAFSASRDGGAGSGPTGAAQRRDTQRH